MEEPNWVSSGRDFDIDRWYPLVAEKDASLTAMTVFVPISAQEMEAIINIYRLEFFSKIDAWDSSLSEASARELLATTKIHICALNEKIQAAMVARPEIREWFVRLSCRSPKDGFPANARSRPLTFRRDEVSTAMDANNVLARMFQEQSENLVVASSFEALHLICSSERVNRDLQKTSELRLDSHIALRAFDRKIFCQWEFRCFVYEGRVNAISQYNYYVVYEELLGKEDFIRASILGFYERIRDQIPYKTCILDVALLVTEASTIAGVADAVIIEFNPFDEFTGSALFHWDLDKEILYSSQAAVAGADGHEQEVSQAVVRLMQQPLESILDLAEVMLDEERVMSRKGALKHLRRFLNVGNSRCVMS